MRNVNIEVCSLLNIVKPYFISTSSLLCHIKMWWCITKLTLKICLFPSHWTNNSKASFPCYTATMWRLLWIPFCYHSSTCVVTVVSLFYLSLIKFGLDKIKFSPLNMFNMFRSASEILTNFWPFIFDVWQVYTVLNVGVRWILVLRWT